MVNNNSGGVENDTPVKGVEIRYINSPLGPVQQQVLNMITKEFLTIKEIARVRHVTVQSVYIIIDKLKEKGYLAGIYIPGYKTWGVENRGSRGEGGGFKPSVNHNDEVIRLHGEQFRVPVKGIFNRQKYFTEFMGRVMIVMGKRILFWEHCVEIYPHADEEGKKGQDLGFWGKDEDEADAKSFDFHLRLMNYLQGYANIKLITEGARVERVLAHYRDCRVQAHYATTHDAIARDYLKRKQTLKIIDKDGKLWMVVDNSFYFEEREAVNPKTSGPDSRIVNRHLNSWRENPQCPTLPELAIIVNEMNLISKQFATGVNANTQILGIMLNLLKSFLPTPQEHTPDEKDRPYSDSKPTYLG